MSVRLVYQDVAVGAEEDASVTSTEAQEFSSVEQLPVGVTSPAIATLEKNSWALDGSRVIKTNQTVVGFWSSQLSDADGNFTDKPALTVLFDKQYTSLGISITFDEATGDYCSYVTITWYQGDTVLSTQDFQPSGASYFCEKSVEHYNKVVIRFNKTSLPYRYAKVSKVVFGAVRTFEREELRNVKVTEQIDLLSSNITINKMDFTLDSKTGVEYIFQRLQPIFAYNGAILIGVFYVEQANRMGKGLYNLSCNDAVGVLDYDTVPAKMYSGENAKSAILELLDGKFELDFDVSMETETLNGYVPSGTRRNALHHIAFSLRSVVDTSGTNKIRVFRAAASNPKEIEPDRTYTGGSVDTSASVTAVKVTTHSYSTSGSGDEVNINGVIYHDTKNVITITNPNIISSDKPNVVEVTDATLVNPSNGQAVAQALYDYYMRRNRQKVKIVVEDERPGDYVATTTPWGTTITGNVTTMNMTLSGIVAADCEVLGT